MTQFIPLGEPGVPKAQRSLALFNLGFRVFFLGAGIFAVLSMMLWAAIYLWQWQLPSMSINSVQWHAHEMIYGYCIAVIAGFLLTAVRNWTGQQTISGLPLLLLFTLWVLARIFLIAGEKFHSPAAFFDLAFFIALIYAISAPVFRARQWKQLGILSKVMLLAIGNGLFYAEVLFQYKNGIFLGIYGGLLLVIGLILTMGRRVLPSFIESGVGYPFKAKNNCWLDRSSLLFFLGFFIVELFQPMYQYADQLTAALALGLFIVNALRLIGWHTPGIWRKSLLWSLYLSFWSISAGFLLFAAMPFFSIAKPLAYHGLAVGGIGVITLSMMSRVALGHTGRSVANPPDIMAVAFVLLLLAVVFRVLLPLFAVEHYALWIGVSQLLWVAAFLIFCVVYWPVLNRPRVDGQPG